MVYVSFIIQNPEEAKRMFARYKEQPKEEERPIWHDNDAGDVAGDGEDDFTFNFGDEKHGGIPPDEM